MNPFVSVIVPHHLDENNPYLKLCLDAILASNYSPFEVICIADTKEYPKHPVDPRLRVVHDKTLDTASAKFNWGAKNVSEDCGLLWLISDDVVITPDAMRTMVYGVGENQLICNPMSNSDNGAHFFADIGIPVKCDITDWPMDLPKSNGAPFLIRASGFCAFYCTMIPLKVWKLVGELDARMESRGNDWDYCLRANQLNIPCMINLGAFALHFGDKTLLKSTTEEERNECGKVFMEKWKVNG